jgi:CO/xanthine dehydrogenase Mo-binding subunit
MILADELAAPWESVRIEQVGADPRYGDQVTGGSQSISRHYTVVRQAGAAARQMLVQAAAEEWSVDPSACRAEDGVVIGPDGQELTFGDLVEAASKLEPPNPRDAALKDPKDFTLINTARTLYDATSYVNGSAIYGTDVRLPGMLYATVVQSPAFEGKVKSFDATAAKAVPGVRDVIQVRDWLAVVADNTWAAFKGRDALQVTWDEGDVAEWTTDFIRGVLEKQAPKPAADPTVMQALQIYEAPPPWSRWPHSDVRRPMRGLGADARPAAGQTERCGRGRAVE